LLTERPQTLVSKTDNGCVSPSGAIDFPVKPCDLLALGIENPVATDLPDYSSISIFDVFDFTHTSMRFDLLPTTAGVAG